MEKIKILILGPRGLLGHQLVEKFSESETFQVFPCRWRFNHKNQEESLRELNRLISELNPSYIINSIVLTKILCKEINPTLSVNSILPHLLAEICNSRSSKLIQISSDGVFSGNKGDYTEEDQPDAIDLYGISKILGEVNDKKNLTIRTSIIGLEQTKKIGLMEWFLSQEGEVNGFVNHVWNGFTANHFAEVLKDLIIIDQREVESKKLGGILHVAGKKINKYELCLLMKEVFNKDQLKINRVECHISIDRSLNSQKFNLLGVDIKDLKTQLEEVKREYDLHGIASLPN